MLAAAARRQVADGLAAELAALRRLDAGKRLGELGVFVALLAGGALLDAWGWGVLPGSAGLHGALTAHGAGWRHLAARTAGTLATAVAINAFILLLHEGMHGTLFAGRRANRWGSVALGATFLVSYSAYRVLHQRHHRFLGEARDPDDYANYVGDRRVLWAMHYLRLLIGVYIYVLAIPALAWRHAPPRGRRRILVEYLLLAALYAAVAAAVPGRVLFELWLLPLILAAHLTAVRGLTQHGIAEAADPFLASRTIQSHPLVAFCLLHENYHLEHHLFPEIPSYHLAAAHRLIWPRLPRAVSGRSYLGFLWRFFVASLRLDETPIGRDLRREPPGGGAALAGWEV